MANRHEGAGTRTPNPWISTVLGLATCTLAATLTVLLSIQYVKSRPVDLIGVSLSASRAVEEKLLTNRVPEENISITNPALRKSADAYWYAREFDVRVPAYLDINGVTELIERTIMPYGAHAVAGPGNMLDLNLGDMTFATIYLSGGAPALAAAGAPAAARSAAREPALLGDAIIGDKIARAVPGDSPPRDRTWVPPVPTRTASRPAAERPRPIAEAPEPAEPAKLAIILDDGGYGGDTTRTILSLNPALTLSILPSTPFGRETALKAHKLGFEVMLHMPMENGSARLRHNGQIEVNMTPERMQRLTERALKEIPHAVGINNHMGSKFTADKDAMTGFFKALGDRSLFFVDSRTTEDSVAYQIAKESGLRTAVRDAFLDHDNAPEAIRKQFDEAVRVAKQRGSYIAIAHFRPNTADLLLELLPTLEEQGIELVHVSELVP